MKMFMTQSFYRPATIDILNAINQQQGGIDLETIDCTFDETKVIKPQRIVFSENKFKDIASKYLANCPDFLVVYQQSDILHLRTDNITVMQAFLINNPNFGAVALSRCILQTELIYNGSHPIISGVTMFTRKGLEAVEFEDINSKMKLPSAYVISSSLDKAGLKYGYVDKTMRIRHTV